ncbi:hypothetical protein ACF0H5_022032 [Mactra antiquata]
MDPETRLDSIKKFKYRHRDVLICSYPKTGTHWVFNLVNSLMSPGPVEDKLIPSPELLDLHPLEKIEQLSSPRVIVSHLKPIRLPQEHLKNGGKIILVARNPRDTIVSHMYHTQRMEIFNYSKLSWNCFFDNWIDGKIPTGSYFDYYNSWQSAIEEPNCQLNVLIVKYENLIKDGVSEMIKIQNFLGTNNTEERIVQILERFSLKRLTLKGDNGEEQNDLEATVNMVKKGVIGHWKDKFTARQCEVFDRIIQHKFSNSVFNYDM